MTAAELIEHLKTIDPETEIGFSDLTTDHPLIYLAKEFRTIKLFSKMKNGDKGKTTNVFVLTN